jgi:hypothetical protein
MKNSFEVRDKTDCSKCQYSRRIPLSSQLTCTHPLAHVQRNLDGGTHGQPYWPVSFDPKYLTSCPCCGFRVTKKAA